MKSTKNIYIDILKFGEDKMQNGISFVQVKEHLLSLGWEINIPFEQNLRFWFNAHFYNQEFEAIIFGADHNSIWQMFQTLQKYDAKPFVMSAKAYATLQDYEKLQETRKSANIAKWIAIGSIALTLVVAVIQIAIQLYTTKSEANDIIKISF